MYVRSIWRLLLRRDSHLQEVRRVQLLEADRPLYRLPHLAHRLRRRLHHLATYARLTNARGPLAHWRHRLRLCLLHDRAGSPVRVQRDDMQRDQALHRRPILLHPLHVAQCYDGI